MFLQVTPQAIFTSFKLPKSNQLPPVIPSPVIATIEEFPVSMATQISTKFKTKIELIVSFFMRPRSLTLTQHNRPTGSLLVTLDQERTSVVKLFSLFQMPLQCDN